MVFPNQPPKPLRGSKEVGEYLPMTVTAPPTPSPIPSPGTSALT